MSICDTEECAIVQRTDNVRRSKSHGKIVKNIHHTSKPSGPSYNVNKGGSVLKPSKKHDHLIRRSNSELKTKFEK